MLGSLALSSPILASPLDTETSPVLSKREETKTANPDPSFHSPSACMMLLHCRDFLFPDLRSFLEDGLITLRVNRGSNNNWTQLSTELGDATTLRKAPVNA